MNEINTGEILGLHFIYLNDHSGKDHELMTNRDSHPMSQK